MPRRPGADRNFTRDALKLFGRRRDTILKFERKLETPADEVILSLKHALENAGAVFLPEGERGIGVRLKFTRSEARRLSILESEGASSATTRFPAPEVRT